MHVKDKYPISLNSLKQTSALFSYRAVSFFFFRPSLLIHFCYFDVMNQATLFNSSCVQIRFISSDLVHSELQSMLCVLVRSNWTRLVLLQLEEWWVTTETKGMTINVILSSGRASPSRINNTALANQDCPSDNCLPGVQQVHNLFKKYTVLDNLVSIF